MFARPPTSLSLSLSLICICRKLCLQGSQKVGHLQLAILIHLHLVWIGVIILAINKLNMSTTSLPNLFCKKPPVCLQGLQTVGLFPIAFLPILIHLLGLGPTSLAISKLNIPIVLGQPLYLCTLILLLEICIRQMCIPIPFVPSPDPKPLHFLLLLQMPLRLLNYVYLNARPLSKILLIFNKQLGRRLRLILASIQILRAEMYLKKALICIHLITITPPMDVHLNLDAT